jgi:hypothetical protein
VVSEGVAQLRAAVARNKYSVSGSGVTVGVLSDSFDQATEAAAGGGPVATHAAEDVASSDLTGAGNTCVGQGAPVNVLEDFATSEATDEGRAMLQIVHDVAPRASLAFATAFHSETSFAANIERLAKPVGEGGAGAKVIVDDVSWFEEPYFQDGPIAAAVNKVTAEGAVYLSAAGNNNLFDASQREIASWEAPHYRDAGTCPPAVGSLEGFNGTHCMNFNSSGGTDTTFEIKVSAGATLTVDLQWDEPWYGVNTDLDAFLLNSNGEIVGASYEDNAGSPGAGATQRPVEVLQWKNGGSSAQMVRLVINRFSGGTPRLKFALLQNGGGVTETEYPASSGEDVVGPTIFGHNGAASAISAGAINYQTTAHPERYSSRGPVTHYFGPVSGTTTPATALPSAEIVSKPDIVATDCGATTFFAFFASSEATWRFCGTSAAAPHAAGVAALELQAKPLASIAEIRSAQTTTASLISGFGSNAVGTGLLNADAAVGSLLPPSAVTITEFPSSQTADSTPTFKFDVSPPSTLTCFIDGASVANPCSSPYTSTPLADGPHTFKVEAADGNKASFSFTVDTVAPTIIFTKRPAAITASTTPTFGFSSSEPAGFTCSVDGATAKACSSPYTAPAALADGPHTFEVAATDQVGNVGHGSVAFTVDTVAPSVTFTSQPPPTTANRTPTFGFASSEAAAFTCTVDASNSQPCSSPFAVPSPLSDGPHTFEVTATDPAGNVGRASDLFTVDTRRPNTFFHKHPRHHIRIRNRKVRATFRFGSNEIGSAFICKVDGGLLRFCGETLSRRFDAGKHFVLVKARDAAGNVDRTPAIFHFKVKRVG